VPWCCDVRFECGGERRRGFKSGLMSEGPEKLEVAKDS
jgi:hypothetical protein